MTRYFKSLRLMIEGLLNFLNSNSDVYSTYDPMKDAVTELTGEAQAIDDAETAQQINIKGYTTVKKSKRKVMALKGDAMRRKVQGEASDKKDPVRYEEMDIPFSKMMYGGSKTAQLLTQSIYDAANALSPADKTKYQISDGDLAAFLLSITEYAAVLVAPRSAISNRRSITESIPSLVHQGMETIETKLDRFVANYVDTDFYSQYFTHRVIVDPAYKITTVEGLVKNPSNSGLFGVKVKGTGKDKDTGEPTGNTFEEITDVSGKFKKPEISPEIWDLEFELDEYTKVKIENLDIQAGEHQKVSVVLQPNT